jgi:hypothetical protein
MASWPDLDQAAPHITRTGRARLNQARMTLMPGTLRPDSSPRISPAEPYFTGGQLISGARDLRRDPRCVLHSAISRPDAGRRSLPADPHRLLPAAHHPGRYQAGKT